MATTPILSESTLKWPLLSDQLRSLPLVREHQQFGERKRELQNPYIKKGIAFYPSQVRNHLDLSATVPCQFIFAHIEAHFDIEPVVATLRNKPNVSCEVSQYAHGFMNPLSDNFDHIGYQAYIEQLFTKKCNEQLVTN